MIFFNVSFYFCHSCRNLHLSCVLSPFLFLLVIDWIMKMTTDGAKKKKNQTATKWTLRTPLNDLDFADDLALFCHTHQRIQNQTLRLVSTSSQVDDLDTRLQKTQVLKVNTSSADITKVLICQIVLLHTQKSVEKQKQPQGKSRHSLHLFM